jgi:hypothetical protein
MQQGIRSVIPQGAQMPGQAPMQAQPMPGMMPSQSGPKPGLTAFVPSLVGLEIPQMLQLFGDPNSPIPKNRVLAAIVEKQKEMAARKSVQNQMAMQQNAGQQGTIADAVVAQAAPVMAAYGGEMQGYAGGGAVAFKDGGAAVQHFKDGSDENGIQSFMSRFPKDSGARMIYEWIKAGRPSLEKPILDALFQKEQEVAESTTDTSDEVTRMLARTPPPVPMTMRDTRGATPETVAAARSLGTGQPSSRPQAASPAPAAAPATPMPGIRATLTADEQRMYDERKAALEGRRTLPAELLAGRAGLSALMQKNLAEERAEAEAFGKEALATRDAALARAQRDVFSDPMALLGLAGTIDTRKGQGMGSFARGLSGIMSKNEAAAEAARKEYATAQGTMRVLQANVRRGNMLEAQRVQAMDEQNYTRVNQIDDAIAQNAAERAKLERDIESKAFDQRIKQGELEVAQGGLKLRQEEAKRGPVPSFQDQMARSAIEDWLKKNPGKSYSDAVEWWRGAGKGVEGRERLGNLKLASETLSKRLEDLRLSKDERDRINNQLQGVQTEILSLLGMSGASSAPVAGGVVTPKSQAEFNALPKGARYINPADGKEYIKN